MIRLAHEAILWLSIAAIMGTCLYLDFAAGLCVAGAGAFWVLRVLQRDKP